MGRLAIEKTPRVLDLFSLERPEWGGCEAARELGIPKSTACELLISLNDQRLLRRTGKGRYRSGWRLFGLGQTPLDTTLFHTEARCKMREIVERWEETAHSAVLEGVEAVYLEKVQPSPAVKILVSRTGARLRAHCSGVGKVLLAHRDWEEVSAQLLERGMPAFTPNTITTLEGLGEGLERVRDRGYAHEVEEITPGMRCAAAPIRDYPGEVAATSPSAPACRFHPGVEELTSAIVEATRHVSEAIGSSRYGIGVFSAYDRKELQKV